MNINLFLMDSEPTGRIKVLLAKHSAEVTYRIPKNLLAKCKDLEYLDNCGIYFLFGDTEDNIKPVVYIGQAGDRQVGQGIYRRLNEHKERLDWWIEAVVFTTTNNSFGPTELCYLENTFYTLAKDIDRYDLKNSKKPSPGNTTEEEKNALKEFIGNAKIVMCMLGHKLFEPIMKLSSTDNPKREEANEFYINKSSIEVNATANRTNEGIVVLSGSKIRNKLVPHCPDSVRTSRKNNKKNIDENSVLKKEILFKTPSGASSFVLGAASNGYTEWKTKDGKTLKDIEIEESKIG